MANSRVTLTEPNRDELSRRLRAVKRQHLQLTGVPSSTLTLAAQSIRRPARLPPQRCRNHRRDPLAPPAKRARVRCTQHNTVVRWHNQAGTRRHHRPSHPNTHRTQRVTSTPARHSLSDHSPPLFRRPPSRRYPEISRIFVLSSIPLPVGDTFNSLISKYQTS